MSPNFCPKNVVQFLYKKIRLIFIQKISSNFCPKNFVHNFVQFFVHNFVQIFGKKILKLIFDQWNALNIDKCVAFEVDEIGTCYLDNKVCNENANEEFDKDFSRFYLRVEIHLPSSNLTRLCP